MYVCSELILNECVCEINNAVVPANKDRPFCQPTVVLYGSWSYKTGRFTCKMGFLDILEWSYRPGGLLKWWSYKAGTIVMKINEIHVHKKEIVL